MAPTFYDTHTFEPLPKSAVAGTPMRPMAARAAAAPRVFDAPATMPVPSPYRIETMRPLTPPGHLVRLVPMRGEIIALGGDEVRLLRGDLTQSNQFAAPVGTRLEADRSLIYMADPLGFLVARRTKDFSIAHRVVPTFPRGYERWVLFSDASSVLFASVEMQQMLPTGTHVPDITMFEWWSLGDLSKVDPSNQVPAGAEATAVTYSRTRPLKFAATPGTGNPLILAQAGHLLWLDRSLHLVADVTIPAEARALALDADAEGRARVVLRMGAHDRYWVVDRGGHQVCDIALPEPSPDGASPTILPGAGGTVFVISGRGISCVNATGVEQWRAQMLAAPVAATVVEGEGGLLAISGRRLYRIAPGGHSDVLFEASDSLTARPILLDGKILTATAGDLFVLVPRK